MEKIVDFEININENRDIKILQLTDFQPVDYDQRRYETRLGNQSGDILRKKYEKLYYYIDKAIKITNPDLILVTGDIVYGEFDDNGSNLLEISTFLNNYNIPWAPIFGNHDNESKKGVTWQCNVFMSMSNCFFDRKQLTGNGNYTIGIKRNNKLIKVIYMLDSNGCYNCKTYSYLENYEPYNLEEKVTKDGGIYDDQKEWIDSSSKLIDNTIGYKVEKFACMHIIPDIVYKVAKENKYQNDVNDVFNLEIDTKPLNGDFGQIREHFCSFYTNNLWDILKDNNFTHVFVGHDHINTLSMLCDGIRVSYGLKTGTYDYCNLDLIGGTLITINLNNQVNIEHKYIEPKGE